MSTDAFMGKQVVLAGRFTTSTLELAQELEAHGAQVARHVSSKVDFMIIGTRVGRDKPKRARALGVNVITEEEARALMRGEQVEVDRVGRTGESNLDELMGRARSVLDKPMLRSTWQELVALLDACHPDQQQPFVHYIEDRLRAWQEPETRAHALRYVAERALQGDDSEDIRQSLYLLTEQPHQSLCHAPAHWLGEMMQHAPSAKYRLVRTLDLRYVRAALKKLARALTHPELTHLDRLLLPPHTSPSNTLIDTLFERDEFSKITYLAIGSLSEAQARRFRNTPSPCIEPYTLDLFGYGSTSMNEHEERTIVALAHAPMFDRIDTLVINNAAEGIQRLFRELLDHDELMPERRRLIWDMCRPDARDFRSIIPLLGPIEELCLPLLSYGTGKLSGWSRHLASSLPEQISTLDLSSLGYQHENLPGIGSISSMLFAPEKIVTRACEQLCKSKLVTHITHLRLGPLLHDERVTRVFEALRPDLELLP